MVRSGQYTVQATILEGRCFTKKPNAKVYIQCRFNHEILTTDPVDHTTSPVFDTELAWDIDSKALSFLRSQRVSLKLICYTIDVTSRRDPLGYIMLDLRAGSQGLPPFPEKWYPLLNSKNVSSFRPEIKISFSIVNQAELEQARLEELAKQQQQQDSRQDFLAQNLINSRQASPIPTFSLSPTSSSLAAIKQLKLSLPVDINDEGRYQMGSGKDSFCLAITIAFAEYLLALVEHPLEPLSQESIEYQFRYTFLGSDVATHRFADLGQPNFPAERTTIRFRSSKSELLQILNEIGNVVITLLRKDRVIGLTTVPFNSLVEAAVDNSPAVVEKVYNLLTPKEELPLSVDGQPPSIGVSMSLSSESSNFTETSKMVELTQIKTINHHETTSLQSGGVTVPQQRVPSPSLSVDTQAHVNHVSAVHVATSPQKPAVDAEIRNHHQQSDQISKPVRPRTATPTLESLPVKWNQFRFSFDLRSIRDLTLKSANIYFRYFYTPFGSSAPVITHPALSVTKSQQEIILPPSFCAFEFVMNPNRLRTYLEAVPLVLEMWHRDDSAPHVLLGTATVNLAEVLHSKRISGPVAEKGPIIQSVDQFVTVLPSDATASAHTRIADVRVVVALEDFGHVDTSLDQDRGSSALESLHITSPLKQPSKNIAPRSPEKAVRSPLRGARDEDERSIHETDEYRVALDLELWKQEEEERFKQHMLTREAELTARLAQEWKTREKEREELLRSKLESYKTLEARLQTLAIDLENREKVLRKGEMEFEQRSSHVDREAARKVDEARDTGRRLQEEYRYRIELEKQKSSELELQKQKVIRERDAWEAKYRSLEEEFSAYRKKMSQSQEAELRVQLAKAIEEKTHLGKELLEVQTSKKKYKEELRRAAQEITKLKKQNRQISSASGSSDDDRKKMDTFKWQVLAKEQLDAIKSEKLTLESVKEDIAALKKAASLGDTETGRKSAPLFAHNLLSDNVPHVFSASIGVGNGAGTAQLDKDRLFEVERLSREKSSLLESGVYQKDDRLIRELDFRIQELLKL